MFAAKDDTASRAKATRSIASRWGPLDLDRVVNDLKTLGVSSRQTPTRGGYPACNFVSGNADEGGPSTSPGIGDPPAVLHAAGSAAAPHRLSSKRRMA